MVKYNIHKNMKIGKRNTYKCQWDSHNKNPKKLLILTDLFFQASHIYTRYS